jgi:hypothetical protein
MIHGSLARSYRPTSAWRQAVSMLAVCSMAACVRGYVPPAERDALERQRWIACPDSCREAWEQRPPFLYTADLKREAEQACARGAAEACLKSGCLLDRRCLESDQTEAARTFYRRACDGESIDGCLGAAALGEEPRQAERWSVRIANLAVSHCRAGRCPSWRELARALDEGLDGLARRPDLAAEVLRAACAGGAGDACRDKRLENTSSRSPKPSSE